jgi:hypothetical protein
VSAVYGHWWSKESIRSTSTIRLRNPVKLGDVSESELRQETCCSEWVAKTWRYFASRVRERVCWVVPLAVDSEVRSLRLLRLTGGSGRISMAVAMEALVIVEVDVAMAALTCASGRLNWCLRGRTGSPSQLSKSSGSGVVEAVMDSSQGMTHGSGDCVDGSSYLANSSGRKKRDNRRSMAAVRLALLGEDGEGFFC